MTKTIQEMAQKASENYLGEAFEQGNYADGYIDGANAVLNEIISCWDWENKDNRLIVPAELVLHKIEDKIKELKGE